MNPEILLKYQTLANQYQSVSDQKKKHLKLISIERFICFAAIIPAFYYLKPVSDILAWAGSFLLLVSFLFLVKKFIQTEKEQNYFQRLSDINRNEVNAMNRDLSSFDPGTEFIDVHHDYSFDLDLYGQGSFFQFLNRTVTTRGKVYLASLLNKSDRPIHEIKNKQTAIQELAENLSWRQHFMATGKETTDSKNRGNINDSIFTPLKLKHAETTKYLLLIFPISLLAFAAMFFSGIVTEQIFLIAFVIQWIIYLAYSKTITIFYKQFESQAKILSQYAEMLRQIETIPAKSEYLLELKGKLSGKNKLASQITAELQKILHEFEYRQNFIVAIVLNLIFLWDIRCILRLYKWQQKYSSNLAEWFEVIAEMDALVSLANCNYNHQEWPLPIVWDSQFHFKSEDLGHPLIDEKKCVRNSFQISGEEKIVIITGANMAGKSTFLRTVGINLILASNGCKVCASTFEFTPIRMYTNMRTTDNLMNDESYFYAELLRLQTMLNLIRKDEKLFVIVDEMLKGTNSVDKLNGSKELINQLIALKTHGIVATHDLGLTELARTYPLFIKNQCFEVQLQNDELNFDYKLTPGVTRTMNATFLMKKMGIIQKIKGLID
ncbi:MAG: hypothetical protein WC384_11565 [Prolixibacteraceae bacterium]|jgi:hypothetical protein